MKKVLLFTGATGSLGREFIERFQDKYEFIPTARTKAPNFSDQLVPSDIRTADGQTELLNHVENMYESPDILINNAVYYCIKPLVDMTHSQVENQFLTNIVACLTLANLVVNRFWKNATQSNRERRRGIINIGSTSGVHFYATQGQGCYSATKSALHMVTRHMAAEYNSYHIRVNAIAPTTFPGAVPISLVADWIDHYCNTAETGEIRIIDTEASYIL